MSEAELEAYLESVDAMSCLPTPPLTEVSSWDTPWNGPLLDSMSGGNTEGESSTVTDATLNANYHQSLLEGSPTAQPVYALDQQLVSRQSSDT